MKKCLYYDENSERRCTHPATDRKCCAPEDQPKLFDENEEGCSVETVFTCYQCLKPAKYLFDDGRCKDCTRLTPEEVLGGIQTDED